MQCFNGNNYYTINIVLYMVTVKCLYMSRDNNEKNLIPATKICSKTSCV